MFSGVRESFTGRTARVAPVWSPDSCVCCCKQTKLANELYKLFSNEFVRSEIDPISVNYLVNDRLFDEWQTITGRYYLVGSQSDRQESRQVQQESPHLVYIHVFRAFGKGHSKCFRLWSLESEDVWRERCLPCAYKHCQRSKIRKTVIRAHWLADQKSILIGWCLKVS